jgi:TfoX/Sxy family transcriptional regulator of competence genes
MSIFNASVMLSLLATKKNTAVKRGAFSYRHLFESYSVYHRKNAFYSV